MIKIIKTNQNINQPIFFKSSLGFLNLFLIDLKIKIPKNVKINNNKSTHHHVSCTIIKNTDVFTYYFIAHLNLNNYYCCSTLFICNTSLK